MSLRHHRRFSAMREGSPAVAAQTAALAQPRTPRSSRPCLRSRPPRAATMGRASIGYRHAGGGGGVGEGEGEADGGEARPRSLLIGRSAERHDVYVGARSPRHEAGVARGVGPSRPEAGSAAVDGRRRDGDSNWYRHAGARRPGASENMHVDRDRPLLGTEEALHSTRAKLMNRYDRDLAIHSCGWETDFADAGWAHVSSTTTETRPPFFRRPDMSARHPAYSGSNGSSPDPENFKLLISPSSLCQNLNFLGRFLFFLLGFLFVYFLLDYRPDSVRDLNTFAVGDAAVDVNVTDSTRSKAGALSPRRLPVANSKFELAQAIAGLIGSASPVPDSAADSAKSDPNHTTNLGPDSSKKNAESADSDSDVAQSASHSDHKNRGKAKLSSDSASSPRRADHERLEAHGSRSRFSSHFGAATEGSVGVSESARNQTKYGEHTETDSINDSDSSSVRDVHLRDVHDSGLSRGSHVSAATASSVGVRESVLSQTKYRMPIEPDSHNVTYPSRLRVSNLDQTGSRGQAVSDELLEKFRDLDPKDVPAGQYPLLSWNYPAVLDPRTDEQYFSLARGDHVATFKPLCLLPNSDKIVTKINTKICSGFNRTAGWMLQYCGTVEDAFHRESFLKRASSEELGSKEPSAWIEEHEEANNVHWIDGLTILHVYDRSCGNIAHFAGRALFLQHVIDNIQAYSAPPHKIENIAILPNADVMKRFRYPQNYGHWHSTLFRAIITPASYTIGTLGNFIYRIGKAPFNGTSRVQLVYNQSLAGSNLRGGKVVCFRQAIVPGFLKSRFFVDDKEYPSTKPSLQSKLTGAPVVSRDAIRLRERVSAILHRSTAIKPLSKRVVFVDRNGKRRNIPQQVKKDLFELLRVAVEKRGYLFEVVSFDKMTFSEQVSAIEAAGVVIGVHGANLVNAMFMPPLSVLIELFPFKFTHGMYEEGGSAGLKYFSYQVSNGVPFPTAKRFKDEEQCIRFDHACKVHYRDAALEMNNEDLKAIGQILENAMDWCDAAGSKADRQQVRRPSAGILSSKRRARRS